MLKRVVNRIKSFTLVELLITVGVITAVAVAGTLILNPAELLKQSRDSTRTINLKTVNAALGAYAAIKPDGFFGLASTTYVSLVDTSPTCANLSLPALPAGYFYHCVASVSLLKNIDGTGWLPVNLSAAAPFTPIDQLPVDPTNSASGGFYYAYNSPGKNWQAEIDAVLESQKYKPLMLSDGGSSDLFYEVGSNLNLYAANHQPPGGGGNNPPPQFNPLPSGWITDSSGGGGQGQGNSIVEVNGVFYIMAGSGKAFQRYDAGSKVWTNMSQMPQSVNNGAVLVKYDDDTLFATRGSDENDFWQYTIHTDTWSVKKAFRKMLIPAAPWHIRVRETMFTFLSETTQTNFGGTPRGATAGRLCLICPSPY